MTEYTNNNKFVFVGTPKTYEVRYLEQQEQQKPKLSLAARSKIVNRNSNYLSPKVTDLVPSYGPCLAQFVNPDGCDCNFGVTAILIGVNGVSRSETISQPTRGDFNGLLNRIQFSRGVWKSVYDLPLSKGTSFVPSGRARDELVKEVEKSGERHGHQTVAMTDKEQ